MTASIPPDIWMHVSQFIPKDELPIMLSVNSTFFRLVMDARYRNIKLSTFDDKTVKYMPRYRHPIVAHCVRALSVDLESQADKRKRKRNRQTWTHDVSVGDVIQAMTDTVICFPNVTTFYIEWGHLPAEEHLLPFLSAAWKTFGSCVQNVVFKVALVDLPILISTAGDLPELRDLGVEICWNASWSLPDEAKSAALASTLADFVNKAAPSLHSLSLVSYRFVRELSPLFSKLRHIPNLERLKIRITDVHHSMDLNPLGLHRFLRDHAETLRYLYWSGLSPAFHCAMEGKGKDKHAQKQLASHWLRETKLDTVFSNLVTLRVPVQEFSLILPCIRLCVDTLTSLRLDDQPLRADEVNDLACVLAARQRGHLRELDIKVNFLEVETMVLLAQVLPRLEHLGITFNFMWVKRRYWVPTGRGKEPEHEDAQRLAAALRECDFRDWALQDFVIPEGGDRFDPELHVKLMVLVAECVPSVRTLGGVPKEALAHIKL